MALLASVPVVLFPRSVELELVELLLAASIALVGFAVAIALVKNGLAGH